MVKVTSRCLVIFVVLLMSSCSAQKDMTFSLAFSAYKALFIEDGRVIDSGNGDVSHSEGQGYGMLFAVAAGDKMTFDTLWHWTQQVLQRDDGLFSWRYRPCESRDSQCIDDVNNASDGELLIAWALLRASRKWGDSAYEEAAKWIIARVEQTLIQQLGTLTLLLPGEAGFKNKDSVQINLSYWVFPAINDIANYSDEPETWSGLYQSGITLLAEAQFSQYRLPSDWVRVEFNAADPRVTLNSVIAPEYGFNAVRIPLHLAWSSHFMQSNERDLLSPFMQWWQQEKVPATVNLVTGELANYEMTQGMYAIKSAVKHVKDQVPASWPELNRNTDYYSASLTLLSMLATMDNKS